MIQGKFFRSGKEGILYRCNDGSLLKVFYNSYDDSDAKKEFIKMENALNYGINVPRPIEMFEVVLDTEDLKGIKKLRSIGYGLTEGPFPVTIYPSELIGKKKYALRREYIEGQALNEIFFPSREIIKKVDGLHRKIDSKGLILLDKVAKNLVLTSENQVYLVDCGELVDKDSVTKDIFYRIHKSRIMTPTCKLEQILSTIINNIIHPCFF